MSIKDITIKRNYINQGPDNFADSFLVPALKESVLYQRSVGYFSSGVFKSILKGVQGLASNGGQIHLVASPQLNEEDIAAMKAGYDQREVIDRAASRDLIASFEHLDSMQLKMLAELIAIDVLNVKIAVAKSWGEYHDKLGILTDDYGNTVVFYGSGNETETGYRGNYERFRTICSWNSYDRSEVEDEVDEFNKLWKGLNPYIETYQFQESLEKNVLEVIERKRTAESSPAPIKLRDYQEQAISAWVDNGYHGFYTMATGTGKTWTAIYSAIELQKKIPSMLVVCAPYKHLIKQWVEDLQKVYPNARIIMVSSENPGWDEQISDAIIAKRYQPDLQLIIVSTIASFNMDRFRYTIGKSPEKKLLIVDEAHRFTQRSESLNDIFAFMLGLSATPYSGSSARAGKELMAFFGGQVFSLPIEKALEDGHLVPYSYHPIFVSATEDEEESFIKLSRTMASCFRENKLIDKERFMVARRSRLRVISMSEQKQQGLDRFLDSITEKDHFVVYCGDGKLFDPASGEAIRHIQSVKKVLSARGIKSTQFTCDEDMHERMTLVDMFSKGSVDALVAIRCLDEGINIPSIKSALILSSNDDYREFVQRRGRILRKDGVKKAAKIYDVVVLPSSYLDGWAKIELRRYHEYAKLATNSEELMVNLNALLKRYGLSLDDVDTYDYDDMEEATDE